MNKEAIVVILDVSPTMKKQLGGEGNQTRFQVALESLRMLIEQKLLYKGSNELGIVLVGTQKTSNYLNESYGNQYENVTTFRHIDKIDLDTLRSLENINVEDKNQKGGDLMDGLIVGMDMMARHCGTKKYKKRVFLISDGEKEVKFDEGEKRAVISQMNESDTRLNVITLDFCDDLGEDEDEEDENEEEVKKEKSKSKTKETKAQSKNRDFLVDLTSKVKGAIFPASVAIQIYHQFKKREVMARVKYRGNLDIAKNLKLNVQIFSRTREENFPTLKKCSLVAQESQSAKEGLVRMERQFAEIDDPDQNPVPQEQQIKAYNYGKQLVPVAKENEGTLKYKQKIQQGESMEDDGVQLDSGDVERQFKLLGFTEQHKVPRHHFIAGVDVVLPVKSHKNERAFASLVNAMLETKRVLIAKIIERKNADPKLVVLYPYISKKKPILYMAQLPTAEDIRDYQFPSLIPCNNKQRTVANEFIKAMDLTKDPTDPEQEEEHLKPEMTYNPALQYFAQVVTHRISHPESNELPQLNEQIADYVKPDKELFERAEQEISAFDDAFELQYNNEDENKKKKRIYWRDIIKREEEKNQEEAKQLEEEQRIARLKIEQKGDGFEFKDDEVKEISSVKPIEDFKKMVNDRKVDRVGDAVTQMQNLIERFVKNSLKGDLYSKAIECLICLRETCVKEDEAPAFNKFMDRIKKMFASGSHKEFWIEVVGNKISLITKKESSISSDVTEDEAKKFLHVEVEKEKESPQKKKKEEDDLMDEIE